MAPRVMREGSIVDSESNGPTITIVYDNRGGTNDLEPAWGFACIIEGLAKTILFDTGGDSRRLLGNMAKLRLAALQVDSIVLSHFHDDHTGGLAGFLTENGDVEVYLLPSFPAHTREMCASSGAEVVEVERPTVICEGASVTGEMVGTSGVPEQCLILDCGVGTAVITGCAHPGIGSLVDRARELSGKRVLLALGGFHLFRDDEDSVDDTIAELRKLGVLNAAPCHCSGDSAIERFAEIYGSGFTRCAVGSVLDAGRIARAASGAS